MVLSSLLCCVEGVGLGSVVGGLALGNVPVTSETLGRLHVILGFWLFWKTIKLIECEGELFVCIYRKLPQKEF